jgi:hypothetical protein
MDLRIAMRSLTILVWHNTAVLTILLDVEVVINPVIVSFDLPTRQRVTISSLVNLKQCEMAVSPRLGWLTGCRAYLPP